MVAPVGDALARLGGGADDVAEILREIARDSAEHVAGGGQDVVQIHVLGHAPALQQLLERFRITIDVAHEHGNAVDQLRNERTEQEQQEGHDRDDRESYRKHPPDLFLLDLFEELALIELGQRIHEIGQHTAEQHGREIAAKL